MKKLPGQLENLKAFKQAEHLESFWNYYL